MSEFRLSPEAEAELDGIWTYIADESGSTDIASRWVVTEIRSPLGTVRSDRK
jgi:plasmid stabilization system protein ParE